MTATEALVIPPPAAPAKALIHGYQPDYLRLLTAVLAESKQPLTPPELELFLYRSWHSGLDPLSKQIYAIKRWDKKQDRNVMSIQVGIDGYRAIADRTCQYAGSDAPVYDFDNEGRLLSATVTVWRLVGGARCPFTAVAHWSEYCPPSGEGSFMWQKMPRGQLGKVAEALALRKGFPVQLSGIYVREEMDQAAVIDAESTPVEAPRVAAPAPTLTINPATVSAPPRQGAASWTTAPTDPLPNRPPPSAPPPRSSGEFTRPGRDVPYDKATSKPLDTRPGTATLAQTKLFWSLVDQLGWTKEEGEAHLLERYESHEISEKLSKAQLSASIDELMKLKHRQVAEREMRG